MDSLHCFARLLRGLPGSAARTSGRLSRRISISLGYLARTFGRYAVDAELVTVASPTQSGWKGAFGSSDGALGINSGQIAYYHGGWQNLAATTVTLGAQHRVGLAVVPLEISV